MNNNNYQLVWKYDFTNGIKTHSMNGVEDLIEEIQESSLQEYIKKFNIPIPDDKSSTLEYVTDGWFNTDDTTSGKSYWKTENGFTLDVDSYNHAKMVFVM